MVVMPQFYIAAYFSTFLPLAVDHGVSMPCEAHPLRLSDDITDAAFEIVERVDLLAFLRMARKVQPSSQEPSVVYGTRENLIAGVACAPASLLHPIGCSTLT
jgi:hypothetical protein